MADLLYGAILISTHNHDSRNRFLSNHYSQSTKKPDYGVAKIPLPPSLYVKTLSQCSPSQLNLHDYLQPLLKTQICKYPSFFDFSSVIR